MALQLQHIEAQGEYFTHYYLCNYRPRSVGNDQLSESLIRFKECKRIDVEAWTECSILELRKVRFGENLKIVRALRSNESQVTASSRTALDWLGQKLQREGVGEYIPDHLSKIRDTRKVTHLSKIEREIELEGVYQFNPVETTGILILDDILTTGTTMKEIIRAIRFVIPSCKICLYTLANTDHLAILNQKVNLSGYTYSWNEEEWETFAEGEKFYENLSQLKSMILNDSFE